MYNHSSILVLLYCCCCVDPLVHGTYRTVQRITYQYTVESDVLTKCLPAPAAAVVGSSEDEETDVPSRLNCLGIAIEGGPEGRRSEGQLVDFKYVASCEQQHTRNYMLPELILVDEIRRNHT